MRATIHPLRIVDDTRSTRANFLNQAARDTITCQGQPSRRRNGRRPKKSLQTTPVGIEAKPHYADGPKLTLRSERRSQRRSNNLAVPRFIRPDAPALSLTRCGFPIWSRTGRCVGAVPQGVDNRLEGRRGRAPAWVVQIIAVPKGAPRIEHPLQPAAPDVRRGCFFRHVTKSPTRQSSVKNVEDVIEDELAVDPLLDLASVFFKLPLRNAQAGLTKPRLGA